MIKFIALVDKRCVACGSCSKVCPRKAITITDGIQAIVDQRLCIGCGICIKTCPAGVIKKVESQNG